MSIPKLCILIILAHGSLSAAAPPPPEQIQESKADTTSRSPVPLSLELTIGAIQHYWKPGLSNNLVGFETEGLNAWWAEVGFRVGGLPVFSLRTDRPFQSSPHQEAMLQAAMHQETGFEEYIAFIDLLPITSNFMEKRPGFAAVVRALASSRLIYTRNLFYGHTSSNVDFAYFPMEAVIDRSENPPVVDGYTMFEAGQPLNFKTEFRDFHFMVPIYHQRSVKNKEKVFRFGYFSSRWEKPSESVYASLEGAPIIQDTRLDTQGISGSYEEGLFDPGLGWRVDSDWGIISSEWTSAIDNEDYLREDEGVNYISFSGELRLNLQILRNSNTLWATLGARGQFRYWNVWRTVRNSEGEAVESGPVKNLDRDRLFQVFATIKIRI